MNIRLAALAVLALSTFRAASGQDFPQSLAIPAGQQFISAARTVPSLPGILHKPKTNGHFPGLVMLCGCSGYGGQADLTRYSGWAKKFMDWGYVVLMMDSFTPRGFPNGICDKPSAVSPYDRANDAFAGKSYLSTLPFVDRKNIGVIGWSHGGYAILTIIDKVTRDKGVPPFKAAVAFYPYCTTPAAPDTPVLVLMGAKDNDCPASLAEDVKRVYETKNWKPEFALTVYPNAYHRFDDETSGTGRMFMGYRIQYDPEAATDAIARTKGFLAKHLGAGRKGRL